MEGTLSNDHMEPSSACSLAAFEGNEKANNTYMPLIACVLAAFKGYDLEDSSLSTTLVASSRATSHIISSRRPTRALSITLVTLSLPNHESYAQYSHSILDYSVQEVSIQFPHKLDDPFCRR